MSEMGDDKTSAAGQVPDERKRQLLRYLGDRDFVRADSLLDTILRDHPDDYEALIQRGQVSGQLGRIEQASRYFQLAARHLPASATVHDEVGRLLRKCGKVEDALSVFRKAIEIQPNYHIAWLNMTEALLSDYRHQELIAACREAIRQFPEDAELHCRLAIGLEQAHQLEESRLALQKALDILPGHPRARLTLAKIEKRAGNLDRAREILEELRHANLAPLQLSAVLVELGNVLDLMGEYSDAFTSFNSSNQAVIRHLGPACKEAASVLGTIDHYQRILTGEYMQGWADMEPDDHAPSPAFLVGFPRSGTTLTEQVITSSGGIEPTDEQAILPRLLREIPAVIGRDFVYPDQLNSLTMHELALLRQHYWTLVREMMCIDIGNDRLLDKLPLNLGEIGLIYRLFPRAPVIVVLRDPRDCCLSCFMRSFSPSKPMNNFLTLEGTARFYAKLMGYWLHMRAIIKMPYLEVRYEDLVADFEETARLLIDHIGAEWDDSVLHYFDYSRKRAVRTPSYSDISRPIFSHASGRWQNYVTYMEPVMDDLMPFIKEFGYARQV